MQEFTAEQYVEAHRLSHELFGLTMTKDNAPLDYSTVNTDVSWKLQGISQSGGTPSIIMDTVMTNMIMGNIHHAINTSIVRNVTKNTKGQHNNSGIDYSGNFDYYSGTMMSTPSDKRFTQLGNNPGNGKTYTAQQLTDKIIAQTNAIPNYSDDYLSVEMEAFALF